jgi:hypothetical protein
VEFDIARAVVGIAWLRSYMIQQGIASWRTLVWFEEVDKKFKAEAEAEAACDMKLDVLDANWEGWA